MKLKVEIKMDNAAFEDGNAQDEAARILLNIVRKLQQGNDTEGTLFDVNGNRVGQWSIKG